MGEIRLIKNIRSTYDGFTELIRLFNEINALQGKSCDIYFECEWFDANMCAPLGAILYYFIIKGWNIKIGFTNPSVKGILTRNRFLEKILVSEPKQEDIYRTTIEFERFERTESIAFKEYIEKHFMGKGLPKMSSPLQKKFRESISELFENAVSHSKTELGIFACGQYFRTGKRLDFSVADLGLGMRTVVNENTRQNLDATQAIIWATTGDNTTRRRVDGKPGGLGLKLLKEFINHNKGKIQIVSDNGFWSFYQNNVETGQFEILFPGTVVNIEINSADPYHYFLASEVNPDDIF